MNYFKINKELSAICEWKKTRSAFKHEATLTRNGYVINKVKICYLNRTWERYEFESVLQKLLDKSTNELNKEEQSAFNDKINNQFREDEEKEANKMFGAIGAIAKMGEILSEDKKGANDWKKRIIEAGLGDKGLIIPEDWETLSEEEKEKRLNKVIEISKS